VTAARVTVRCVRCSTTFGVSTGSRSGMLCPECASGVVAAGSSGGGGGAGGSGTVVSLAGWPVGGGGAGGSGGTPSREEVFASTTAWPLSRLTPTASVHSNTEPHLDAVRLSEALAYLLNLHPHEVEFAVDRDQDMRATRYSAAVCGRVRVTTLVTDLSMRISRDGQVQHMLHQMASQVRGLLQDEHAIVVETPQPPAAAPVPSTRRGLDLKERE
jgi:DNA-directed RNA polymerase subunit RPC12/RpoP